MGGEGREERGRDIGDAAKVIREWQCSSSVPSNSDRISVGNTITAYIQVMFPSRISTKYRGRLSNLAAGLTRSGYKVPLALTKVLRVRYSPIRKSASRSNNGGNTFLGNRKALRYDSLSRL